MFLNLARQSRLACRDDLRALGGCVAPTLRGIDVSGLDDPEEVGQHLWFLWVCNLQQPCNYSPPPS